MRSRVPYDDPGTPDSRGPWHYLWWLVRSQRGRIAQGALWGVLWMLCLMLPPYLISRAIDDGMRRGDVAALLWWSAAIVVVYVLNALLSIMRHRTMTFIRVDGAYRTVQVLVRHMVRLGAELPRRVSAGEVANVQAADIGRVAQTLTVTGPGVGAVVAYGAVAVVLWTISPLLAVVVLLGVPVLAVVLGPLLGRLDGVETTYREKQGEVTALAGDIVAGLRVLCGIGGKGAFADRYRSSSQALRAQGYRVGVITSCVQAVGVCLPVLFLAVVTWIAVRMAASGAVTIGDVVAVYGYVAVLVIPVSFFIEGADDITRGVVAARRVARILAMTPDVPEVATPVKGPEGQADLHDPASGLTVPPGRMTALVSGRPADCVAVVDRLARHVDSDVTWGGVPLSQLALSEVRRRILVADNEAYLFAGSLRAVVTPGEERTDTDFTAAVRAAAAEDVLTAMPDGAASAVDTQGRNMSGGQRQRLRLVRALLADPDVLVMVEPTSSVDAHTEARVAERILDARRDRTTLVVATSPLLLDRVDEVFFLVDGRVAAVGTHERLLASDPRYRALVHRGDEIDADETHADELGSPLAEGAGR